MDKELISLATQLAGSLSASGQRIAVAESCTGGWIAQVLTTMSGSSAWFDCGFVTYSNRSKMQMLQVEPGTLAMFGAVSSEVVLEMLSGVIRFSQSDCAIAVSGIAGPEGGSEEKPVGTVYIGWLAKGQTAIIERLQFSGDRESVRFQSVKYALSRSLQIFR